MEEVGLPVSKDPGTLVAMGADFQIAANANPATRQDRKNSERQHIIRDQKPIGKM